ncbi:hypothetical protein BSKO_09873 [Bryopsis sp. KO-2023]|nr:hypothetical protein BSKO_09873 [Bryopsis sp. KO-2023]
MGFALTSWLKRLVCAHPKEPLTPKDWRDEHYDEPLNEQDLLDLQETIDAHSGLVLLHGQALRKYEERLARLAKIYQRTATLPISLEDEYAPPRGALWKTYDQRGVVQEAGVIVDSPVTTTHLELPQQHSPVSVETVREEEQIVRPRQVSDDINRLEREVVTSFSPRQLALGNSVEEVEEVEEVDEAEEVEVTSRDLGRQESGSRKLEEFPRALLRQTQSIAGTSDFYADEFQTPCEPGISPSDNSFGDASPPRAILSPRLEATASLGIVSSEFQDKQPLNVTYSRDYDVIEGQKPSRPLLSDDPLNDELLFHSEGPPLSPNSESVRKVTAFYRESLSNSPEWKVKNAIFAAADIRATSDSAGSLWEDDRLTRLIPEKVESSKLVFDKARA